MNSNCFRSSITAVLLLVAAALSVSAADERKGGGLLSTDLGGKDLMFLHSMVQHGLGQLQLAELAKSQATIPEVKALAAALETEYAAADEELRKISDKKGVQAPAGLAREEEAIIEKIGKTSGARFDKSYIEEVVRAHKKQVVELETAIKSSDADIKAFATELLPVLQEQLALALNFTGAAPKSGSEPAAP